MINETIKLNLLQEIGQTHNLTCTKCQKNTAHVFILGWNHNAKKYLRIYRCSICKEVEMLPIASVQEFWEIENNMKLTKLIHNY